MARMSNNNGGKGSMTTEEAGRIGGERTASSHGHEFYQEIGHMGGSKGGKITKQRYGREFYQEIGHKGGQKVRDLINRGKQNM